MIRHQQSIMECLNFCLDSEISRLSLELIESLFFELIESVLSWLSLSWVDWVCLELIESVLSWLSLCLELIESVLSWLSLCLELIESLFWVDWVFVLSWLSLCLESIGWVFAMSCSSFRLKSTKWFPHPYHDYSVSVSMSRFRLNSSDYQTKFQKIPRSILKWFKFENVPFKFERMFLQITPAHAYRPSAAFELLVRCCWSSW